MPKPGWPSSSSSRAGTIHDGVTPPSDICHPSTTKGASDHPLAQIHNCPRNRGNSTLGVTQICLYYLGYSDADIRATTEAYANEVMPRV